MRRATRRIVILVPALAWAPLYPFAGAAQEAAQVEPVARPYRLTSGDRVRLESFGGNPYTATFRGLEADTLILEVEGVAALARIPSNSITHLEVQRRGRGHGALGAVIGFVAGVAVVSRLPCTSKEFIPVDCGMKAFFAGGIPGLVVGGLVGVRFRSSSWEVLNPVGTTSPQVALSPQFDGSVRLSFSFPTR